MPPALVFANPAFLRACRQDGATPAQPMLHLYAVDLLRGPDGAWRVLADRTDRAGGPGLARENRRLLARVMPEVFRGAPGALACGPSSTSGRTRCSASRRRAWRPGASRC